jgi:hypothetical protein
MMTIRTWHAHSGRASFNGALFRTALFSSALVLVVGCGDEGSEAMQARPHMPGTDQNISPTPVASTESAISPTPTLEAPVTEPEALPPGGVQPPAFPGGVDPSPSPSSVPAADPALGITPMAEAPAPLEPSASTPEVSMPDMPTPVVPVPAQQGDCTFDITGAVSEVIPTVGIVEWSVDLVAVESATIEFGLDTTYGMVAPVDLAEQNLRTLLLGMKGGRDYHYRVVVNGDGKQCQSADGVLSTGSIDNGLVADPEVTTMAPEKVTDGYLIAGRWGDGNDGPAFILDKDRDFVWWYPAPGDVIRARMTYDGKGMWIRNTGQAQGSGVVLRVSLDGLEEERWDLGMTTHDLAVLPDGKVGLTAWDGAGCAEILELDPADGTTETRFNASEAHGASMCHVNNLQYYAEDDSYTFSDYNGDCFVKISRSGELIWVLNGAASDFTGTSWSRQHGLHILSANHLLMFSNGAPGLNSIVHEFQLDTDAMTATELWSYDGGVSATYGGDVQRLTNGNTIITYSSAGVVHEVDAAGTLVQSMAWPIGNSVSYTTHQESLYMTPPPKIWRFDDEP